METWMQDAAWLVFKGTKSFFIHWDLHIKKKKKKYCSPEVLTSWNIPFNWPTPITFWDIVKVLWLRQHLKILCCFCGAAQVQIMPLSE